MTTDPVQSSVPERDHRASDPDRREPIQQDVPGQRKNADKALEFRCRQVTAALRDTLGPDGCSALLSRALAQCERTHPVLAHMRGADGREIQLDGVSAGIERFGYDAAEAGVEAMLASLLGILGKLIGEDMTMRLLDLDASESSQDTP